MVKHIKTIETVLFRKCPENSPKKQIIDVVNDNEDCGHGKAILNADGVKKIEAMFRNWCKMKKIKAVTNDRTTITICSFVIWSLSCEQMFPTSDMINGCGRYSKTKNTILRSLGMTLGNVLFFSKYVAEKLKNKMWMIKNAM